MKDDLLTFTGFLELARARRTARKYQSGSVSQKDIWLLAEALRWAPSAANTQPWEIVVVDDRRLLSAIKSHFLQDARGRHDEHYQLVTSKQAEILDTALLLGIAGNSASLDQYIDADQIPATGREELFFLTMGAAIQNLLLMATSLGLATTWIARLARIPKIGELLRIQDPLRLVAFVALGQGTTRACYSENLRIPIAKKVHHNRIGEPY